MEISKLKTNCPLCGGNILKDMYNVNGFTITRCSPCSLVFVREEISSEQLIEYYNQPAEEDFIYADAENVENLNYYFLQAKKLIEQHIPRGRVLDIGCSAGYFLDTMDRWERYGIEIPSMWAEMAREKYGDNIHIGTLEDSPYPSTYFDVITLQDVLDHLPDPLESLQRCRLLLKPGGLLLIKVHNIECLYARLSGRNFYAIIPPSHLFYYSDSTLRLLLEKTGFLHMASKFIGHTLFIKTVPYRLSRSNQSSFFYKLYQFLDKTSLGNFRFHKNLHDIITVIGVKPTE